ncbi:MAG: MFS transporter [Chromatiaceae bacterium]|nr:MFS transporter [Chromatiaceae bacterium]
MNSSSTLSLVVKSFLVFVIILAFNLFFLFSTFSEGYDNLGSSRFSDQLYQSGQRMDSLLSGTTQPTRQGILTLLESEQPLYASVSPHSTDGSAYRGNGEERLVPRLSLLLNDGTIISTPRGDPSLAIPPALKAALIGGKPEQVAADGGVIAENGFHYFSRPVSGRNGSVAGVLVLSIDSQLLKRWKQHYLNSHYQGTALLVVCALALVLLFSTILGRRQQTAESTSTRSLLLIISATQVLLLLHATLTFHLNQNELVRERAFATADATGGMINTAYLADRSASDSNRAMLDTYIDNLPAHYQAVTVTNDAGEVVFRRGDERRRSIPLISDIERFLSDGTDRSLVTAAYADDSTPGGEQVGLRISIRLSDEALIAETGKLLSSGLTMLLVSFLLTIEVMVLANAVGHSKQTVGSTGNDALVKFMRPAMFLFLFGIDLSMAFLPLHMREIYTPLLGLPMDVVIGLPISVEFLFVGLFFLLAGFWVDARGWHQPFLVGLLLATLGAAYSWYAPDAVQFIFSRALVGAGYGLALMASQGFVVIVGGSEKKAAGFANLFAGLYAGSICGAVAGSVLAEKFGYPLVFFTSAVVIVSVIPFVFAILGRTMSISGQRKRGAEPAERAGKFGDIIRFLVDPTVLSLILLSSLPASIAVAGFIHFFTPAYLDQLGLRESTIGQILMIYGTCQIFIGPRLGKIMDRSQSKKAFVTIGNLFGCAAFLAFYFELGVMGIAFSVLLLGVSSSFVLASQSTMLLNLKVSARLGQGVAIGIFRSSSRIGQVLGPMIFGAILLTSDINTAITYFGAAYLITLLLFAIFAKEEEKSFVPGDPTLDTSAS